MQEFNKYSWTLILSGSSPPFENLDPAPLPKQKGEGCTLWLGLCIIISGQMESTYLQHYTLRYKRSVQSNRIQTALIWYCPFLNHHAPHILTWGPHQVLKSTCPPPPLFSILWETQFSNVSLKPKQLQNTKIYIFTSVRFGKFQH